MRVLLVEDDEDLSGRIASVLRSENFVVDISRNGEDALHAGLTELFDVAVLDLGLPKIDGVSVLKGWTAAEVDGAGMAGALLPDAAQGDDR